MILSSYDKPRQHIKKQRHHFADKGVYRQSYVFSSSHICESWMWQLDLKEGWSPKNWCFWTVVLEKILIVLWTARSKQSVLKKINPEYSLEGLMLKLQYFGHLMQRTNSLEKTLMLGKIEAGGEGGNRGWDSWMASPTQRTWVWVNSGSWHGQGGLVCYSPWIRKESDTTEWLNWNWNIKTVTPTSWTWVSRSQPIPLHWA